MTSIGQILRGRSDLSAFVVHFTRGVDPQDNIKDMLANGRIEARNPHGWHLATLRDAHFNAVCFTETPLEFLSLLCGPIDGRAIQLTEWGLAFGKYKARLLGANPVMYAQGFPNMFGGVHQPANALDALRDTLAAHDTGTTPLAPRMVEAFKTLLSCASRIQREGGTNEWWWEREWRRVGDDFRFHTDDVAFGLCPREKVREMEAWVDAQCGRKIPFLSPSWTIEETVSHLAGLPEENPPWPDARY